MMTSSPDPEPSAPASGVRVVLRTRDLESQAVTAADLCRVEELVPTLTGAAALVVQDAALPQVLQELLSAGATRAVVLLQQEEPGGADGLEAQEAQVGIGVPAGVQVRSLRFLRAPDPDASLAAVLLAARNPARGRVVAVTGALGGRGVSTFLLHLARASAALGRRVALVDLDPAGGLGLLLGEEVRPGLRWADLPAAEEAFRPERLVGALPTWIGVPVLTGDGRGGAAPGARADGVLAALAVEHDLVLVDLPRGMPVPDGAEVILLAGLDLRAAVASQVLVSRMRLTQRQGGGARLLVGAGGEDLSQEDLVAMTGCEVVGQVPRDRSVAQRTARGDDPTRARGGVRRVARQVAALLLEEHASGEGSVPVTRAAWCR